MGEKTAIAWTDHSWSPWIGCTRVSDACDRCYAATLSERYGWAKWGAGESRKRTAPSTWRKLRKWNAAAERKGRRETTFPSLCDPFDSEVDPTWLGDYMAEIEATPWLTHLLLTKRPQLAAKYFASRKVPDNVWLGITAEDQKMLELRGPTILDIPCARHFLSYEPALGAIDGYCGEPDPRLGGVQASRSFFGHWWEPGEGLNHPGHHGFTWVIAGGESGPQARPAHPDWFRSVRDQCQAADVFFFFKQWGGRTPKAGGKELDGREWCEFPVAA